MAFADEFPQVELQRSAVDIIKDWLIATQPWAAGTEFNLDAIYLDSIKDLLTKLD